MSGLPELSHWVHGKSHYSNQTGHCALAWIWSSGIWETSSLPWMKICLPYRIASIMKPILSQAYKGMKGLRNSPSYCIWDK